MGGQENIVVFPTTLPPSSQERPFIRGTEWIIYCYFSATRPRLFKLPKTLVSSAKWDKDMVFLDPFDVTLYTMFGKKKAASERLSTKKGPHFVAA